MPSIPLTSDLEVLLVVLQEVIKPRQLAATLPSCDKTHDLTLSDCVTLARGFNFLTKISGNEDAIGRYFDNFPVMRDMQERNPVLEEVRNCLGAQLRAVNALIPFVMMLLEDRSDEHQE